MLSIIFILELYRVISYYIVWYCTMLYYIVLYYTVFFILRYIIYIILCYIILCYVILYFLILYYDFVLYYFTLNAFILIYILCIYIYNIVYYIISARIFLIPRRRWKRGIAWPMLLAPRWFQFCRLRLATVLTTTRSTHMSWTWKGQGRLERRQRGDFTGFRGGFDPEPTWFRQSEDRLHKFIMW